MPIQDADTLKSYFNAGDVPTESNYIDLIDSIFGAGTGASGNKILLYHSNGDPRTQYPLTGPGLTDALGAALIGDIVLIPSCSIPGTHAVPADVSLVGYGMGSILTGVTTCNGYLLNIQWAAEVIILGSGGYHVFNSVGDLIISKKIMIGSKTSDTPFQRVTIQTPASEDTAVHYRLGEPGGPVPSVILTYAPIDRGTLDYYNVDVLDGETSKSAFPADGTSGGLIVNRIDADQLPAGFVVGGIKVTVVGEYNLNGTEFCLDSIVEFWDNDDVVLSTNKASPGYWGNPFVTREYGSETDKWGIVGLDTAMVNGGGSNFAMTFHRDPPGILWGEVDIDYIEIEIFGAPGLNWVGGINHETGEFTLENTNTVTGGGFNFKPDGQFHIPAATGINNPLDILSTDLNANLNADLLDGFHASELSPHVIQDEGDPLTAEPALNFVGAGVTVSDDPGVATIVTIPGGGGANAEPLYVASFFDEDDDEKLHILTSEDALSWVDLNITFPERARDPSIMWHDGLWYIAHTNVISWGYINPIYSSPDLLEWTKVTDLDTSALGNEETDSWAPEWFVDDDDSVHLLVACGHYPSHQIYETHPTNSEWTTWSNLVEITGTGLPADMIDAFLVKVDGTYNLFYKDDDTDYICLATSTSLTSGYTEIHDGNWTGWGGREGECIFRKPNGEWRAYFNTTLTNGQSYSDSADLETWSTPDTVDDLSALSHGTIFYTGASVVYEAPLDGLLYGRKSGDWDSIELDDLVDVSVAGVEDGQTLLYDSGNGLWLPGTPTSGGNTGILAMIGTVLLDLTVSAGGQASVDLTSIPTGYDEIVIQIFGKSEKTANLYDGVNLSFNNDTTDGNYETEESYGGNVNTINNASSSSRKIAGFSGLNGNISSVKIHILGYDSAFYKTAFASASVDYTGVDTYIEMVSTTWRNVAVINRITLTTTSGSDFSEGSKIIIIGYKEQAVG